MKRIKKKFVLATAAAACAGVLVAAGALPASAAFDRAAIRDCGSRWTLSAVNSTAQTTHFHEQGAWWKRGTLPAGSRTMKGFKGGGPTWIEVSTKGTARSYSFGCSS